MINNWKEEVSQLTGQVENAASKVQALEEAKAELKDNLVNARKDSTKMRSRHDALTKQRMC